MAKKISDTFDIDDLAKTFGIPTAEKADDGAADYAWEAGDYAYKEALKEDATESEAEEAREKAEQDIHDRLGAVWRNSFEDALGRIFEEYADLNIEVLKSKPWLYRVSPRTSWKKSAEKLIDVINGVGYFYFSSVKEFADSGPWTVREAVLGHIHWLKDAPRVYGDVSAERRFERSFEASARNI